MSQPDWSSSLARRVVASSAMVRSESEPFKAKTSQSRP